MDDSKSCDAVSGRARLAALRPLNRPEVFRRKELRGIKSIAALTCAAAVSLAGVSTAHANPFPFPSPFEGNSYEVTGFSPNGFVTSLTTFTLTPAPNAFVVNAEVKAVCAMSFRDKELTSAPWTFTYDPAAPSRFKGGGDNVDITHCDGTRDLMTIKPRVPFSFNNQIVGDRKEPKPSEVVNNTNEEATVTVVDSSGGVVSEGTINPLGNYEVKLPRGKKQTTRYTTIVSTPSGLSMSVPFTVAKGWGLMMGVATVTPCSVVTWAYDESRAPKNTKTFKKDIVASLDLLSEKTGLTFVETEEFETSQLRYNWGDIRGAGAGNTDGSVTFSTTSGWPRDYFTGFKKFKPFTKNGIRYSEAPPGRGWLIVHETMHALGFAHVDDEKSVMSAVNTGQAGFTKGDLEGLNEMYRSRCAK